MTLLRRYVTLPSRRLDEQPHTTASGLVVYGAPSKLKATASVPTRHETRAKIWLERSKVSETGREIFWKERQISPGVVERRYLNPPLSQRSP